MEHQVRNNARFTHDACVHHPHPARAGDKSESMKLDVFRDAMNIVVQRNLANSS
jgi:hypothetical protein